MTHTTRWAVIIALHGLLSATHLLHAEDLIYDQYGRLLRVEYDNQQTVSYDLDQEDNRTGSVFIVNRDQVLTQTFEADAAQWTTLGHWRFQRGGTPSPNTGPHQAAASTATYLYFETSGDGANRRGETASITTPKLQFPPGMVSFYYHMYGSDIGQLSLDVLIGNRWVTAWSRAHQDQGSSGESWIKEDIDLSTYLGTTKIRFHVMAAGGERGDIALDQILIQGRSTQPTVPNSPSALFNGFRSWESKGSRPLDLHSTGRNRPYKWMLARTSPMSSSGPRTAHAGRNFAYMDTRAPYNSNREYYADLETPYLSQAPHSLDFHYHMYGSDMGNLRVELLRQGEWQEVWCAQGQQHSSSSARWSKAYIPLWGHPDTQKIRIRGTPTGGANGIIGVDLINGPGTLRSLPSAKHRHALTRNWNQWRAQSRYNWRGDDNGFGATAESGPATAPQSGTPDTPRDTFFYAHMPLSAEVTSQDTAILQSPDVGFDIHLIQFNYHLHGPDIEALVVESYRAGKWHEALRLTGPQQTAATDSWQHIAVLPGGPNIRQIRFRAIPRGPTHSRMAIHDVTLLGY